MKKGRQLQRKYHGFLKICTVPLCFILAYQGLSYTVPFVSEKLNIVTIISAGLSFFNGGMALAEQEMTTYQEQSRKNTNALQSNPLDDTISQQPPNSETTSEEISSEQQTAEVSSEIVVSDPPPAPERTENSGDVIDRLVTAGDTPQFIKLPSGYVKNLSALTAEQILEIASSPSPITLENTSEPQVLIYHTHATESYQTYDCDWYDLGFSARNADNTQNMVAVGNILEQKLLSAGIGVIHDTTQHDNPSYTGAYKRSKVTIENYLAQYPSIKVVLDIHRDALQGENVITAPTTEINGKKTAQLMMICCSDDGNGSQPNYIQNLSFACAIQQQLETDYPTITRPILLDDRNYNQELSAGALLVEVGGHGNTLAEAQRAMELFGESLIKVLKGN